MEIPTTLVLALTDRVLAYMERQTVDRQPTDEEILMVSEARRIQAAAAQADADSEINPETLPPPDAPPASGSTLRGG
ncbi:MAG: hypothetical protein AAGA55_02105 [Planctomycetota bacterium]